MWYIRDGQTRISTGILQADVDRAQEALANYILSKQLASGNATKNNALIAQALEYYIAQKIAPQKDPARALSRIEHLIEFFGAKPLSELTPALCRDYVKHRTKSSARREIEDLRAACNLFVRDHNIDAHINVALPQKEKPRDRWLTRDEFARILKAAWSHYQTKHVARFMLVAYYTGTRHTAICNARFKKHPDHGFIDLERALFYRLPESELESNKRQTPAPIPKRLLHHMRRWEKNGLSSPTEYFGKNVKSVRKAVKKVCIAAGFKDVSAHTFRHTTGTRLMQNKTNAWAAAGYLGVSLKTLERTYGHHHPDYLKEAAENINLK